jgi:hypothetical protein
MKQAIYSDEFLSAKRLKGDEPADRLIENAFADTVSKSAFYGWFKNLHTNNRLQNTAIDFRQEELIQTAPDLPIWIDQSLLRQGAEFYLRHSSAIMQLLGLLSLPYCYAAANGARVIYLSERLRGDTAKRLADTGTFVQEVLAPNAFSATGKGFAAILKTRLIHATARHYTSKSDNWNTGRGTPINQEDMAGTNLAFSLIVIRGLRKPGISISYQEQQAFLHLWSVIGCKLGLDEDLILLDGKAANLLEKSIRQRQFKASEHGRELTRALLQSFTQIDPANPVSIKQVKQFMCYFLDQEVAEMLGINDVSVPFHVPYLIKAFSALSPYLPAGSFSREGKAVT